MVGSALIALCFLAIFGGLFYGGVELLWVEGDPLMLGIACFGVGMFATLGGFFGMGSTNMTNYSALVYERSNEQKGSYEEDKYNQFIVFRRMFCVGLVLFLGGVFVMLKYD